MKQDNKCMMIAKYRNIKDDKGDTVRHKRVITAY